MSGSSSNTTMAHNLDDCTEVSYWCPISATVLGYEPNLGSSIFFAIAFGTILVASFSIGMWKRTWGFTGTMTAGLILETVGYVGRGMLNSNAWDQSGFEIQICCIILAPTMLCASIYLTFKHVTLTLNPALSRIRPTLYPYVFLPADITCLFVQAIGGGIAASAGKTNQKLINGGNHAIIAGVALQVVVLAAFGIAAYDYLTRVRKYFNSGQADPQHLANWHEPKFRKFLWAVCGAYTCILLRCIYRIAEMAGGWGNFIMQNEPSFLVLDSSLILVAVTLLCVFHPGFYFTRMCHVSKKGRKRGEKKGPGGDTGANELTEVAESGDSTNEVKAGTV